MCAIASDALYAVKCVNSFARRQHLLRFVAEWIDVDSNILSYPVPLFLFQFRPKRNPLIRSWL